MSRIKNHENSTMKSSKSIPVRYSEKEYKRVEQAASDAGYKFVSAYIRDASLNRETVNESMKAWEYKQDVLRNIRNLEKQLNLSNTMIAMLVYLIKRKASSGEVSDLRAELVHRKLSPEDLVTELLPEFGEIIEQLKMDDI